MALLGWSWSGAALAIATHYVRMFFLTAGFHRYFSHRAYRTERVFQFLLDLAGTMSAQKGVLWWAAIHRRHHRYADQVGDVHSPRQRSLWWAHAGWFLSRAYQRTDFSRVRDLTRYPELRWLNRFYPVPVVSFAALLLLVGGAWALVWGFLVSTTLLWHGTFTINSLAHRFGRRRYRVPDDSRNSLALALLTLGEGWHNNHHRYPSAATQGFFWWEVDVTHYVLRALAWLRIVHDLRLPPDAVLAEARGPCPGPAPASV